MARRNPTWQELIRKPTALCAFGFGSGLSPKMPGTMGTLAAVPLYGLLQFLPMPIYFLVVLLAFVVGIYLCGKTAQWMGEHDHGGIVWDEFVGFWITMALVPAHWLWVLLGFVYFRVFDIAKPWPISWLDRRVHGGLGIMIDDVLAGVAAALCLYATVYFLG